MDDINSDSTVDLNDHDLIDTMCEDGEGVDGQTMFSHPHQSVLNEHLNVPEEELTPRVVIVSNNDDTIPSIVDGEQSAKGVPSDILDEKKQTFLFTIDGECGLFRATSFKLDSQNNETKFNEKEGNQVVGQSWFTTRDDKSKLHRDGHEWKQGMWSKEEISILDTNIKTYCLKHNISDPAAVIFEMTKDERKDFYRSVAKGLNRPLFSVYRRVIRMYDKKNYIGRYTDMERSKLKKLHEKHGNDWQTIGNHLGRSASSIKDKCRLMKDNCNTGKWFPEEEKLLAEAVYELSNSVIGEVVSTGISWTKVSEKVGTRSEKQCRTKWLNYLNWKQVGGREWTREDDVKLITRIYKLCVDDENDIDWNSMAVGWKSVRSPQWLRGKWWSLKRHIANVNEHTFKDICNRLYTDHVVNAKFASNSSNSEIESIIMDDISNVELLTQAPTCLSLPQVQFVSIPNMVHIPQTLDTGAISSDSSATVFKSDGTPSVALQTFEIVAPNATSGTFFIASQGTAIQYPANALTSSSPIILQTSTDQIQMSVPTQLIITDRNGSVVASTTTDNPGGVSQFTQSLLGSVSLNGDEIGTLTYEGNTMENEDEETIKHANTTVQTDLDVSDENISSTFILSDPILQGASGSPCSTIEEE